MLILKLPLLNHHVYINASKILWFEPTKTNCTELHLDSGECLLLAITPDELLEFMNSDSPHESDTLLLNPSDLKAIYDRS